MDKIINISNLSFAYDWNKNILEQINFSALPNDFWLVTGPNGGGKTTFLKLILGLLRPTEGEINFFRNGQLCHDLRLGYLPQINHIDKHFPISVKDVLLSGLKPENSFFGKYSSKQLEMCLSVAEMMGITSILNTAIGKISGGQLQRTMLGRAIIGNPELLILDEPDTYIDRDFGNFFYNLLHELNQTTTIIMVSHDLSSVKNLTPNSVYINHTLSY